MSTATRAYDVALRRRPWILTLATIGAQIAYPLVDGESLRRVTIASVVLFFLASFTHAWAHRGRRWALTFVVVSAGIPDLEEAVDRVSKAHPGFFFGRFDVRTSTTARGWGA